MSQNLYPKGPLAVPADLTTPSKSYKKHVWIASAAILLFMALYLGLSAWFLYKAYKLAGNMVSGDRDNFLSFVCALVTAFLGVFMLKALFFITKRDESNSIEITREEQPELFEFIYRVADEAKAPRPHKVFISDSVNACVFYDISIINLIFPSRKNLEIGLGLVNTLNLGEFKAVLAHEFGHFGQKSMIIGRWVYIAHKVAYQIVAKRDAFDKFLSGLSGVDIRVAWIGWLLSIIVWSLRAISETFFKIVLITQRALSREMEFQADLVAVSTTGSDAIVNSLYKLGAADEAYENAISFVNKQLKDKKGIKDIYHVQSNAIKHLAIVLNNPLFGQSPKIPSDGSKFRVFKEQLAQAPKMWNTHPANIDREKNAKAIYIKSEADERSSWLLFKKPEELREKVTLSLYKKLKTDTILSPEEYLPLHNKEFERSFLSPGYRGVYLNRHILLSYKHVADIYKEENISADSFSLLYPEQIQSQLEHLRNLDEEVLMLDGLNKKELDVNEGKINYRGKEISRKDLPSLIESVKKEAQAERGKIEAHDRLCRNVFYNAAGKYPGWQEYLVKITSLVHYCEHSLKNIESHHRFFYETLSVVSKIRNISDSEIRPLLDAANDLYDALDAVFSDAKKITLHQGLLEKMGVKHYQELLEPFKLGTASRENINSWIGAVNSWVNLATECLTVLREAALDELLQTEELIKNSFISGSNPPVQVPVLSWIPEVYSKFNPGAKKEVVQKPDLFSRFYFADGLFPAIARVTVAAAIVLFVIIFSSNIGQSSIVIYNGMPVDVIVQVDDRNITVGKDERAEVSLDKHGALFIKTLTKNGVPIEDFPVNLSSDSRTYIYNIAHAAFLYKWTARYGSSMFSSGNEARPTPIGAPGWMEADADYYFEEPPETIQVKAGQTESKDVIMAYKGHPEEVASSISDSTERNLFIATHATWEESDSKHILTWLGMAAGLKSFPGILNTRLANNPLEVVALRMQQELYKDQEKDKICEQQNALYLKNQGNADLYYLKVRCMPDSKEQDSLFLAGHIKWPDNTWLAYATAFLHVQHNRWEDALECFNLIYKKAPALREAIADDMKRTLQYLNQNSSELNIDEVEVPYLGFVKSIEESKETSAENKLFAYKLLAQGKLHDAIDYSSSDSILHTDILRLAAVSDGASEDIVKKALSFPNDRINRANLIPAMALAVKKNNPLDIYKEALSNISFVHPDTVLKFVSHIKTNNIAQADRLLNTMPAEMKAKVGLLGVLILEKNAPLAWREFAIRMLYINERPYKNLLSS